MKYISQTVKYLKSNLTLLTALAVAAVAFAPIFDYDALGKVVNSFADGRITQDYFEWLYLFLPVNTKNVFTVLMSVLGYVLLVLDLSFIHSMVDKHVRFGTKSFRSIMSSFTVNFSYALLFAVIFAVIAFISSFLMAAVMKTFSMFSTPYAFVAGIALCAVIILAGLFVFCHFSLWLSCLEVTGFRVFEALSYSYALARPKRWKIFLTLSLPLAIAYATWIALALTCSVWIAVTAASAVCAGAFIFISTACYLIYADAEGIEREDLKKF